jgi:hypothetical protein
MKSFKILNLCFFIFSFIFLNFAYAQSSDFDLKASQKVSDSSLFALAQFHVSWILSCQDSSKSSPNSEDFSVFVPQVPVGSHEFFSDQPPYPDRYAVDIMALDPCGSETSFNFNLRNLDMNNHSFLVQTPFDGYSPSKIPNTYRGVISDKDSLSIRLSKKTLLTIHIQEINHQTFANSQDVVEQFIRLTKNEHSQSQ